MKSPPVPSPIALASAALADVSLLDIDDICAVVRMSPTWIHDAVRNGRFPKPMRFGPRCTRWTAGAVREWLIERVAAAADDTASDAIVTARAEKASHSRTRASFEKAKATRARNIAERSTARAAA